MSKLTDFLSATKILEVAESPINGRIEVVKTFGFGPYIKVSGLTQSGGILFSIWNKVLKKVKRLNFEVKNCLVLGLGGGTVVKLVKKYWPDAKITGVDIDPIMVSMGKKYLELSERDVKIFIEDAKDFITKNQKLKNKFDLILVDTYIGEEFPKKLEGEEFLKGVKNLLSAKGIVVFNRLYFGEKRKEAVKFLEKLEGFFLKVEVVYPHANVMFLCSV